MTLTVLVERLDDHTYRAETAQPVTLRAEGSTREEAVQRLQSMAAQRLSSGEILQISVPEPPREDAWSAFAGVWKDHPDFDAFLENIAEYRREIDAGERPE